MTNKKRIRHGLRRHKLYGVWAGMKRRCYNANDPSYKNYGARGIIICDEWLTHPDVFIKWALENGWKDTGDKKNKLEVNKINNEGNYEPGNCNFIPPTPNCQNRRLLNSKNTSGYHGVWFHKRIKKWQAGITSFKKDYHLGYYDNIHLASVAYNNFVIYHKTHHPLNPIPIEYQHLIIKPE